MKTLIFSVLLMLLTVTGAALAADPAVAAETAPAVGAVEITLAVIAALLAISEALSFIPAVKSNGVFQAVAGGLRSLRAFLKRG